MGLALFGVRGYLTRLTRSWYLISVWPFGLYTLAIYAGVVMGIPASWYAEALFDVSDGAARAGLDWNATRLGLLPAALATYRCA